ncbi:MAG: L-threonylcarbamoyladenylate synthase [Fibrobacterota bacterium]
MIIEVHPQTPNPRKIAAAAEILRNGGLVSYPCDTTYAVGCDLFNKKAVDLLYRVLKKDKKKLLSCIIYDISELSKFVKIPDSAYKSMRRLLPGPYTFILKGNTMLPKATLTKRKTAGIRMPANKVCEALQKEFGGPVLSGALRNIDDSIINTPYEIEEKAGHCIDMILDGGRCPGAPSSIVDFSSGSPVIIREGSGDISILT